MAFPQAENETRVWLRRFERPYLSISCGAYSYGRPSVACADVDYPRKLEIGRYCSIAEHVALFVGIQGRHPTDTLSTYPLLMAVSDDLRKSTEFADQEKVNVRSKTFRSDLDLIIGDDVWIGTRSIIMSGVTLGTGCVVAAGAVVTRSVEPYQIVGGVPAKPIGYRHSPAICERLLKSRWWELEPDELFKRAPGNLLRSIEMNKVLEAIEAPQRQARAPLAGKTPEDILSILTRDSATQADGIPRWPSEDIQKKFTGGSGLALLGRTLHFIEVMKNDGAFDRPDWKGLDFGCGWGRIASGMLTQGTPDQLDICDAWSSSLDLARQGGCSNAMFKVSDIIEAGEIPESRYDFCYAMSVFTHLDKPSFEQNLASLVTSLKPRGRLYFTVRHSTFLDVIGTAEQPSGGRALDEDGFWHVRSPGKANFGDTVVEAHFIERIASRLGSVDYLGLLEYEQHLYRLTKP